jgi:flagellar FliL protein
MKKIILIVVVILLLIGGAVGGLFVVGFGPFAKRELPNFDMLKREPRFTYTDINAVIIPMLTISPFDENPKPRQLYLSLRLVYNTDNKEAIMPKIPKLRDAYLREMMLFLPEHMRGRKIADIAAVKLRLVQITNRTMGEGKIQDVLFREYFEK